MLIVGLLFGLLALAPLLALALLAVASSERVRAVPRRVGRRIGQRLRARAPSAPDEAQAATTQVAARPDDAGGPLWDHDSAASLHAAE
jgi:hypothetical protein